MTATSQIITILREKLQPVFSSSKICNLCNILSFCSVIFLNFRGLISEKKSVNLDASIGFKLKVDNYAKN